MPKGNAYRTGFTDGLFGRESNCPWKHLPHAFMKNANYMNGYMRGQEALRKNREFVEDVMTPMMEVSHAAH